MTEAIDKRAPRGVTDLFTACEASCAATIALALPWEVHQRVPFAGLTLVKAAGAGLIVSTWCRAAAERRSPVPRTGLNGAIALLAVAALVSTAASASRGASVEFIRLCVMHVLLFFAMASSVRSAAQAQRLAALYIASCAAVGVMTLACKAGFLMPTYWRPSTYPWSRRLVVEAMDGTPMRLVAASGDLNQGALLFLLGFAASLHLFDTRGWGSAKRGALFAAQAAMVGACVIAQSRSALMAAAAITALSMGWRLRDRFTRRTASLLAAGGAVALAAAVWIALTHFAVRDEDSVASRMVAYRAAINLVPQYLWLGTGLAASDHVIALTDWGSRVDGATVHSVPLKVLLECGLLGLAGYVWLWAAFAFACYRSARSGEGPGAQRLGAAGLALGTSVLAMSLVQPFMTLPSYPFFFGLVLGPIAAARTRLAVQREFPGSAIPIVASAVLTGALVVTNIAAYQRGVAQVERLAQQLELGAAAERDGRYDTALATYRTARGTAGPDIASLTAFDALSSVIDLPRAYASMGICRKDIAPRAASLYAEGRCLRATGDRAGAVASTEDAVGAQPALAEVEFALAESYWADGRFTEALAAYATAAQDESLWPNRRYRETTKRYERRLDELQNAADRDAVLERARILRLRGRWGDALAVYAKVAETGPACADALFHLGANAEVQHDPDGAMQYYGRAVDACPDHVDAARRRDALGRKNN